VTTVQPIVSPIPAYWRDILPGRLDVHRKLQRFITRPGRIAFVLVHGLAVRAQTVVAVLAPVKTLTLGSGRVPLGFDVKTLPVEECAAILPDYRKCGALHESIP